MKLTLNNDRWIHLGQKINEHRDLVVFQDMPSDALIRFVDIEHKDFFGKYNLRLAHNLNSRDIELLIIRFEPDEEKT